MGRHRKSETDVHAARIPLHRRIQESLQLSEGNNLVEFLADLGAAHAEDGAVEVNVLAACELGVEAGADLEQARHPATDGDAASAGLGDAREDLQEGRLSGAVAANDPHHFPASYLERDLSQRRELLHFVAFQYLA